MHSPKFKINDIILYKFTNKDVNFIAKDNKFKIIDIKNFNYILKKCTENVLNITRTVDIDYVDRYAYMDIKYQRKQKLKEICSKSEID